MGADIEGQGKKGKEDGKAVERSVSRVSYRPQVFAIVPDQADGLYRSSRGSWSMGKLSPPAERKRRAELCCSPFGSASEDFAKFETILLVGGKLPCTAKRSSGPKADQLCSGYRRDSLCVHPQVYMVSSRTLTGS